MNVGEVIELNIESNGMNGEGVARIDGKVVFVPYTLCGERVRAVVKTVKKQYAVASVIKVILPSPERITPECPHYYKCGGCDMGHVSAEYRKSALVSELKNNLKKIANISVDNIEFITSVAGAGVRNKLSMPFGISDGSVVLGLYRQNTHIVERVECKFASERMKHIADIICEFANTYKLSVYDERTGRGALRHLVLREIGERVSATLVVNSEAKQRWETELGARLPEYADFFICPNMRRNNVILGDTVRFVRGKSRLDVNVLGVKAELSPLSFLQVNDDIRDKLYGTALDCLSGSTLIDLYSGIGITSNLAAKKCARVVAVECVPQAVEDADRTAALNGNEDKITNICGNVEDVLSNIAADYVGADILIDPPRKGCGAQVMRAVASICPERIVYISCNHATMCRDIALLTDYEIAECKLFDMFPNTHHVETLVYLVRK